jgi:hypothetical protein
MALTDIGSQDSLIKSIQSSQTGGVTEFAPSVPEENPETLLAGLGNKLFSIPGSTKKIKETLKEASEVQPEPLFKTSDQVDENFTSIYKDSDDYISNLDINFNAINTSDDFENLFKSINEGTIYKNQGVETFEEVKKLAKDLDMDSQLLQGKGFSNAKEVYAARQFVAKSGTQLLKLADQVVADPTNTKTIIAFKKHLTLHGLYVDKFVKGRADVGRALGAFRIPTMADPIQQAGALDNILANIGGAENIVKIAEETKSLFNANGLPAVNKYIGDNYFKRAGKAWREAYRGGLLFSVKTQAKNILGNKLYQLYSVPEYILAGVYGTAENAVVKGLKIDKALHKLSRGKYWGDYKNGMTWEMGMARLYGMIEGSKDAFVLAKNSLQDGGVPKDGLTKYEGATSLDAITAKNLGLKDGSVIGQGVNFMGKVYRLPYMGLTAGDEFYKELARSMEMHTLLMENATILQRTQGLKWEDALAQSTEEIMSNPTKFQKKLDEAAAYYTYQDQLPAGIEKMTTAIQDIPFLGTVILPFAKTPVNIARRFLDLTTGGLIDKRVLTDTKYRAKTVARLGMLSMFYTGVSSYYQEGRITGGYPLDANGKIDYKAKAALDAVGWKPYSLVFAGDDFPEDMPLFKDGNQYTPNGKLKYVAYNGLEPVGAVIGVIAHANELMARAKDPDVRDNIAAATSIAVLQYMKEMPMIQGMSTVMDSLDTMNLTKIVADNLSNMVMAPILPLSPVTGVGNVLEDTRRDTSADFERDMNLYISDGFKEYQEGDDIPDGKKVGDFILDQEGNKIEKSKVNFNYGNSKGNNYNFLIESFNKILYKMPYDEIVGSVGNMVWGVDASGKELPPKYDIFGNELKKTSGRGLITDISNTFINPFTITISDKKAIHIYENMRLGSPITNRKANINGVKLKPQEYADWIVLSKRTKHKEFKYLTFDEYIQSIMTPGNKKHQKYLAMSDNEKYQYLQELNSKAFAIGKEQLLMKYPELGIALGTIKDAQDEGILPVQGVNLLQ